MPNLRENYFARWGTGLATSSAVYAGIELIDKSASPGGDPSLASTVEWFAQGGAFVSGFALALGGIHIYAARNRQKQIDTLRASLPKFAYEKGQDEQAVALVHGLRLNERVKDRIAPVADIGTIATMRGMGFSTEERVKMVADDMVRSLAIVRQQPPGQRRVMADFWFDAADMGYVLDNVYPINPDDALTPVTVPGEKHWFDFAENQAIEAGAIT